MLLGWNYGTALLLSGAIVILYTAIGGYLAVTYTDRVQVALVLLGIVAIGVPVAISHAGSWGDMRAALPASFYDLGAQGWDRIAALVVSMVLSFFVAMDSFSRSFAARDAATARNGALLTIVLVLPIALAVAWLGLASAVLYPGRESGAGILTTFVLEAFPAGLKGLMVIGILSAIMSVAAICVHHGVGELHARHPPALHPAGNFAPRHAAARHAGIAGRGRPGDADGVEDARHHRHPPARLHHQLGSPVPADDCGDLLAPCACRAPRSGAAACRLPR